MKLILFLIRAGLLGVVLPGLPPAAAGAAEALRLHPENPHYFLFRGKPTVLLSSGEHYGAVINLDFDYVKYLAALERDGLNGTRTWVGAYCEPSGAFQIAHNTLAPMPERLLCPWARTGQPFYANGGNKFDLNKWDNAYFKRLKDFVNQAAKRGVIVEINLFCPFYEEAMWWLSPMNPINNVNGLGDVARTNVYTLDQSGGLLPVQEALVRKVVRELNQFDNVYYELCNEPYFGGVTLDWQQRLAEVITESEKGLGLHHLISQNIANGKAKIEHPHPAVSIFNFHYASPPDAVAMNYDLNKIIGDNETGFRGTDEAPYRMEAWDFIVAGGGLFNNLDYSFTAGCEDGSFVLPASQPGGGGPTLRRQLRLLAEFIQRFDFVHMHPENGLLAGNVPAGLTARVLAKAGQEYVLYLRSAPQNQDGKHPRMSFTNDQVMLEVKLPAAEYVAEWFDTKDGSIARSGNFTQTQSLRRLPAPAFDDDIALSIRQIRSAMPTASAPLPSSSPFSAFAQPLAPTDSEAMAHAREAVRARIAGLPAPDGGGSRASAAPPPAGTNVAPSAPAATVASEPGEKPITKPSEPAASAPAANQNPTPAAAIGPVATAPPSQPQFSPIPGPSAPGPTPSRPSAPSPSGPVSTNPAPALATTSTTNGLAPSMAAITTNPAPRLVASNTTNPAPALATTSTTNRLAPSTAAMTTNAVSPPASTAGPQTEPPRSAGVAATTVASGPDPWAVLFAGGGLPGNLARSGSATPALRNQLRLLDDFAQRFDLARMQPDARVVTGGVPAGLTARTLVKPGQDYLIYLHSTAAQKGAAAGASMAFTSGQVTLETALPPGEFAVEWFDTRRGLPVRYETFWHRGGSLKLAAPAFKDEVLLSIQLTGPLAEQGVASGAPANLPQTDGPEPAPASASAAPGSRVSSDATSGTAHAPEPSRQATPSVSATPRETHPGLAPERAVQPPPPAPTGAVRPSAPASASPRSAAAAEAPPVAVNGPNVVASRMEAWERILAGGVQPKNLDRVLAAGRGGDSSTSPALRAQLRFLTDFARRFDLGQMRPDNTVVTGGVPPGLVARVLAQPPQDYIVYLRPDGLPSTARARSRLVFVKHQVKLAVALPRGEYTVEWFDPSRGLPISYEQFNHPGGVATLAAPAFAEDIALAIRQL